MSADDKIYTLKELQDKLTEKERIFSHEYIIDWNKSRAARKAGYSENTCGEIGYENLKKPHIKQYIEFIKDDVAKEAGITKLRQLNELAKIAYSSIAHLHNTWVELKDFENLTDEQKDAIESTETKTEVKQSYNFDTDKKEMVDVKFVKIKLYPKITAIQEINKMLGYNAPEKIDHGSSDGSMTPKENVNYSNVSSETLKQFRKEADDNKS